MMEFGRPSDHEVQATEKQMKLIHRLIEEKQTMQLSEEQQEYLVKVRDGMVLTRHAATKVIDGLFELPRKPYTPHFNIPLEDGMYKHGDVIYKVQKAVHGSGRQYAKKLCYFDENGYEAKAAGDGGGWKFIYQQGAVNTLSAEEKMSLEDAQEFGRIYGVCCRCGATLTDESSIEAGIGPICASKF